jgi:signal transduction histidine kinase
VSTLARALARRLARAAAADCTTVWLFQPAGGAALALAAAWPERAHRAAPPLALAQAPCAEEAFGHRAALWTRLTDGPAALGLDGRHDAPVWVIPLVAGTRRLGLAYVVGGRAIGHDANLGRVLTLLATQAALAACALGGTEAGRREDAEFLAVVAHDLKNVATSIKGYTQLLRRHLPAETAPRAGRWTGIVEQQVGVLTSTLSALVDLGRLRCGRVALDRQPVDLRQIVEAAAGHLPADAAAPPLGLQLPNPPVLGTWDAARLERALGAALESMRHAMPPESDGLAVVVAADPDEARLCVGAPTPDERWPAPGEWAASAEATLYLLRGIVEAHGGSARYRRTADGQPLLEVNLPVQPPAS